MLYPDIQIVDENDTVIGQMQLPVAVDTRQITRSVIILVVNMAGQVLLQKRSGNVIHPHLWDLSCSGSVDADDGTYLDAAERELKEELGISGAVIKDIGKFKSVDKVGEKDAERFNNLFIAEYGGVLQLDTVQVEETIWLHKEEVDPYLKENDWEIAPRLSQYWPVFKTKIK